MDVKEDPDVDSSPDPDGHARNGSSELPPEPGARHTDSTSGLLSSPPQLAGGFSRPVGERRCL